jgi:hypothetical protein
MNKVHPRGYLGCQDWLWWAHTFVHRFQNESALPRLSAQTVVGGGFLWFPSDRLSVFANWGAGTDRSGPATTFQFGFANSF